MYVTTAQPTRPRTFDRGIVDFALIFASLIMVALIGLASFWHVWHLNRIYAGVQIAGISVGGMTRTAALNALRQQVTHYPLPPITLSDGVRQWPVDTSLLSAQADWLAAVNQAYGVGRQGAWNERITSQVSTALSGESITPRLQFDDGQLQLALDRIAEDAYRPAQAGIESGDVVIAAQPGLELDVSRTMGDLSAALRFAKPDSPVSVPMAMLSLDPNGGKAPVQNEDANLALANLPASGLQLRDDKSGLEFAIDPATARRLIASTEPFTLDELATKQLLARWAKQVDVVPRDARLRFNDNTGEVSVLRPSQAGRKLDIDATYAAIQSALAASGNRAVLSVTELPPEVDMNKIGEMGIVERIVSASTYFKGSSASRIHNIETGAEMFDGVVIPPGQLFSFNKIVEDVTLGNGFEDALVIFGDATVNGVGGGICQVSTTVFRAALYGGFPFYEWHNHAYVVRWYGDPGLDATIFTPSVDFKFRNDTGAYLLIEPYVDSANGIITFNFYGTKPQREVVIDGPIELEVKDPPATKYEYDATLPEGTLKQTEWAAKGMTVKVVRTITDASGTRSGELISKYAEWGEKWKYGPNAQLPNAAPAAPLPTATPPIEPAPAEPAPAEPAPVEPAPAPADG